MRKFIPLVSIVLVLLTFQSCKKSSKAEEVADAFYSLMMEQDYEGVVDLFPEGDDKDFSYRDAWMEVIVNRDLYWGKVKSYKKISSEIKIVEGQSIIELKYEVDNNEGKTYEILRLMEFDGKMMIRFYSYTDNPSYIENSTNKGKKTLAYFPEQEKTISKFYSLLMSDNFENAYIHFSDYSIEYSGIDQITKLIKNKNEQCGKLLDYKKVYSKQFKSDNSEYRSLIYEVSYEDQPIVFELFDFILEDEPDKINYYAFDKSYDALVP